MARALGLDKTPLMFQLDGLEKRGLVVRRPDARDRRSRIPEATAAALATRAKVAAALSDVEGTLLSGFTLSEQRALRSMLCMLIGVGKGVEEVKGSCLRGQRSVNEDRDVDVERAGPPAAPGRLYERNLP